MIKGFKPVVPLLFFVPGFLGCSVTRQLEHYPLATSSDIILTAENHPHGYGHSQCFLCHLPNNIHQEDRLHLPSFGLARDLVSQDGIASCSGCHGGNGVQP